MLYQNLVDIVMNLLYIFCFLILLFTGHSLSYPLCTNSSISIFSFVSLCVLFWWRYNVYFIISGIPIKQKNVLKFCPYHGTGCCDSDNDEQLENQFRQMNISSPRCASLIRSILCAVRFWGPRTSIMSIFLIMAWIGFLLQWKTVAIYDWIGITRCCLSISWFTCCIPRT